MKIKTMLCLGDSYTIGEKVAKKHSWPFQVKEKLKPFDIDLKPTIIAQTGWTADDLLDAILLSKKQMEQPYDYVSLLIGVNNQYRGYPFDWFKRDVKKILKTVQIWQKGVNYQMVLINIPNYSYFPVINPDQRSSITEEIHTYNIYLSEVAKEHTIPLVDIDKFSFLAGKDELYVAEDQLHPSGALYAEWSEKILHSDPLCKLVH